MKKTPVVGCIASILVIFFAAYACAAENKKEDPEKLVPAKADTAAQEAAKKAPTDAERAEYLTGMIEHAQEVVGVVPGLKEVNEGLGKISYTYLGTPLNKLKGESLNKLYATVQNEVARIRNERLNKQLENIRQSQQALRNAQQVAQPPVIPAPPPQVPYVPPTPQNPNVVRQQNPYTPPTPFQPPAVTQPPSTYTAQTQNQTQQPPKQPALPPEPPRR